MAWDAVVIGGGQAGLTAARELTRRGLSSTLREKEATTSGSRRGYYDSLTLFTPAHLNSLGGEPFPGSPHRYPSGIEVAGYLEAYAESLSAEVRTGFTVDRVSRQREHYLIHRLPPSLGHLSSLEQFDSQGFPLHRSGLSRRHRGLAYVGLEYQRTMLSGTLHGANQDAAYVARRIARTLE